MKYTSLLLSLCLSIPLFAQEAKKSNSVITDYGTVWSLPQTVQPDSKLSYRIVIDLKSKPENPNKINPGLYQIARFLNLLGAGGIPSDQVKLAVAVHGSSTSSILDNKAYQEVHQVDNPNIDLIRQLKAAGVDLYVCGQSLKARGYQAVQVNPDIQVGLSMLTVVSEHMMRGYHLMVFD